MRRLGTNQVGSFDPNPHQAVWTAVSEQSHLAMEPSVSEERSDMAHDGEEDFGLDQFEAAFTDLRAVVVRPAAPEVAADHLARMQVTSGGSVAATAAASSLARHAARRELLDDAPQGRGRDRGGGGRAVRPRWSRHGRRPARPGAGPRRHRHRSARPRHAPIRRPRSPPTRARATTTAASPVRGPAPRSPRPDRFGSRSVGRDPRQRQRAPGQSGSTPGQSGENPSVTAPGQSGESPSATAPGQVGQPFGDCPRAVRRRSRPVRERRRERQRERERRRQWERQRGRSGSPAAADGGIRAQRLVTLRDETFSESPVSFLSSSPMEAVWEHPKKSRRVVLSGIRAELSTVRPRSASRDAARGR